MDDVRVCYGCDFETVEALSKCPQCGGHLRRMRTVRRLGWLSVGLGSFLVAFMGAITVVVVRIVARSDQPGATTTFAGDSGDLLLIYGVFGVVIAIGLASIAGGVWQIKYGRPNRKLVAAFFVVALVLVALSRVFRHLD